MKRGIVMMFLALMGSIVFVSALTLTVTSPANAGIFNKSTIDYVLTSDEVSDFYIFKNRLRSNRAVKLCNDVTSCNASIRAREGSNNVTLKIINVGGMVKEEDRDFIVDTRVPRIMRTRPRDGKYMNNDDNFSIMYTESNLKKITLFFGNDSTFKTSCESGKRKICDFNQDLSLFDDQTIKYWFDVEDVAGNKENSSVREVMVDTTKPNITGMNYTIDRRKVKFAFDIEEKNFDKIIIKDHNDRRPRWRRLCSKLIVGKCTASKRFRSGEHLIDVKALDKAGNEADIYVKEAFSV
ncbi:hypothetical protein CMI42_00935 [Candidatus Pacearchaeota archaeon]|nr:hypothetical protein [Candidatus Pacearchaeota archaeon]|tara:strand:+ start:669 stop:1553 length:885 start_codon:yes stop_codon:yes gene_type:complete